MSRIGSKRTKNLKAVEELGLPTPRLQFRWEKIEKPVDGMDWFCHYELVLKLDTNDIRNPHEYKKPGELTLALGGTRVGKYGREPFWPENGIVDTPFRDGAHAHWDGLQLGIKHVYAIYGERITDVLAERAKQEKAA